MNAVDAFHPEITKVEQYYRCTLKQAMETDVHRLDVIIYKHVRLTAYNG
jgi:hypothetical protein